MRLKQAITTLILDAPFFATLLLNLKIEEIHDETQCPNMQTDGTSLQINPAFVHTLTDPELTFVLAHEVLHCALGHIFRLNNRAPQQWNIACDYIVNAELLKHIQTSNNSCMRMPKDALYNPAFADKSAEQIYNLLPPAPPQQQPNPCGSFTGPPQQNPDGPSDSADSPQPLTQDDWKIIATQAVNAKKRQDASDPGETSSNLERLIKQFTNPSIPWTELLRQFCDTITRDDYSWTTPNPRYLHTGFILPTLRSQSLGHIIIAIDTSMSVHDELLAKFLTETQSLLDIAKPAAITLLSCDYQLHNPQTFHPGDNLTTYKPIGGGGTLFQPVFDYIQDQQIDPLVLIYFTDGQAPFPHQEPHYPTLWVNHGPNIDYPFGHKIDVA